VFGNTPATEGTLGRDVFGNTSAEGTLGSNVFGNTPATEGTLGRDMFGKSSRTNTVK
jgi:uncharacterized protein (DUF342 family)